MFLPINLTQAQEEGLFRWINIHAEIKVTS